jgi:APA family basic amino acid/polyamine antiporter
VVALVAMGALLGHALPAAQASAGPVTVAGLLRALAAGLFAYGGWHMVTYSAGETVDPGRTIPRALALGTLAVTAMYMALNAVYFRVLPLARVATSTRVASEMAETLLGPGASRAVSAVILLSALGALTGIVLAGPRVYYAMAEDGLLFRWLGALHPKYRTPHRALVLQGVLASVLVATGSFHALFTRVVYTEWIFFGLLAIGLFRLRHRPGLRRDYEVWGYPALPVLFALAAFGVAANAVVSNARDAAVGLSVVLAGLPIYRLWKRFSPTRDRIP